MICLQEVVFNFYILDQVILFRFLFFHKKNLTIKITSVKKIFNRLIGKTIYE